jgi:hypothetical protein
LQQFAKSSSKNKK